MKEEYIKTLDLVNDMRRAQRAYFGARKRNDHTNAERYLEVSKRLEREVDNRVLTETDRLKHGEQGVLFK